MKNRILFSLLIVFFNLTAFAQMPSTNWLGVLQLNDTIELPIHFYINPENIVIENGEEKIYVTEIERKADSIIFRMPVFDAEFRCKLSGDKMIGFFYNYARKTKNIIPFHAELFGTRQNNNESENPSANISGRYHMIFDSEADESKDAVGIFKQDGIKLSGTILTNTGDYRYLYGEIKKSRIWLYTFDGSHLFLFTALVKNDSLYNGEFFSGQHWHDTWRAKKDEHARLTSPDSLTFLKPGYDKMEFSFPDENGKLISLADPVFKNKPVIIQIMGSWCPNCMDETKFLSNWYNSNRKNIIEIIALDYERILDTVVVNRNIRRLKKQFNINYPVLFAGSSDKKEAAKTLPMLSRVFAFPTMIFLDKNKNVLKIHTGFNGPATGEEYDNFVEWFDKVIGQLK